MIQILLTIGLLLVLYIVVNYRKEPKIEKIPIHEISVEKTSNNRYRVKVVKNTEVKYFGTSYKSDVFVELDFPEEIRTVRLVDTVYAGNFSIGTDFTEKDLPNLYKAVEYYKKYQTFDVVHSETIEKTNLIKNTITEEQLTILELVPLLIIADKAGNKDEADNILDSIEILLDKK